MLTYVIVTNYDPSSLPFINGHQLENYGLSVLSLYLILLQPLRQAPSLLCLKPMV
jgi:hypothetical protein